MARPLSGKQYTEAPGGDYPLGRIRDKTVSVHGTPVNENVYGDFHQFFAKMADEAGVTLNGQPDNDYVGYQYIEALVKFIHKTISLPSGSDELATGSTNLNDHSKPGIYSVTSAYTNKPGGLGATAQLVVSGTVGSAITQRMVDLTNAAEWVRTFNGTVWTAWTLTRPAIKVLNIGEWVMTGLSTVDVAHGLDIQAIIESRAFIRDDSSVLKYPLTKAGTIDFVNSTNVRLARTGGGFFDSADFDSAGGYNRGYVIVEYVPY